VARLLLGVSGGIAAYKALELARLAMLQGHAVRVVQTEASLRFVGKASFEGITGAPVLLDEFERDPARGAFPDQAPPDHAPLSHLELVANADAYLIAPASANTLAKLAAGLADNLLTTCALAATCPVLVAPAMNHHMWQHAATQANVQTLRARGVTVLEPGTGPLGSRGEWGTGRLPEPPELLAAVEAEIDPPAHEGDLAGVRVLVTAGGTREPIDAVRFVGNRSSGRMGFAVADEAARRGAAVTCVAANVGLPRHAGVEYVDVETAAQLATAARERFENCDVLVMAAAVGDFRPAEEAEEKIKKDAAGDRLDLRLERTEDILAGLSARRRAEQVLVGFAAEFGAGNAVAYGRDKLARKGLDAVVVNDISRSDIGFDADANEVSILTAGGDRHVGRMAKSDVARAVLDAVVELLHREDRHGAAGAPEGRTARA
jgi:phosphopantothenoylcysteine decarboxylase / phosphopantothenate---cysteine ligase